MGLACRPWPPGRRCSRPGSRASLRPSPAPVPLIEQSSSLQVSVYRVHTEWRYPISGVHPIVMEKSALAGVGGGCKPTPFAAYYHYVRSCSVRSSCTDTLPLFHLCPIFTLCLVQFYYRLKGQKREFFNIRFFYHAQLYESIGYGDFNDLMGSISKKLHFKIFLKIFVKRFSQSMRRFLRICIQRFEKLLFCELNDHKILFCIRV